MNKQLSVIIPVHNHGHCIESALNCLARQDVCLEIIVVDDASDDNSSEIAQYWAKNHNISFKLTRLGKRSHALAARLTGVEMATAPHIMFLDADDILLGKARLGRALAYKEKHGCEILHFRSQLLSPQDIPYDEFLINAPLGHGILHHAEIFDAYSARLYPPVLLWGKIYSRTLLNRVSVLAQEKQIFRFDDKFLTSLLMLHAISYTGYNEYIYAYRPSTTWPMEKYAGRVHDLLIIKESMPSIMRDRQIAPDTIKNFMSFVERRLTINMGHLCIAAERCLFEGDDPDILLEKLSSFMNMEQLFSTALISSCNNTDTVIDTVLKIRYDY